MSELITIHGVSGYIDGNGTAQLRLEPIARGLGFTTVATSGNEVVRWNTVYKYLADLGVATSCNGADYRSMCPEFIPENIFYRLAMKAKNETAENFQAIVADEILPAIRKHGAYMTPETIEKVLCNPDTIIKLAIDLKALRLENNQQKQLIGELRPKATYYDVILDNKGLVTVTQIAKDYGMSGTAMNKLLHELGIQYNQSDQWLLYAKYHDKGYTHSHTVNIERKDGTPDVKMQTKWTQKGRLFLYELLRSNHVLPIIEKEKSA